MSRRPRSRGLQRQVPYENQASSNRCYSREQPWPGPVKHTAAPSPGITGAIRNVGEAMGLLAAVLIPVVLFFWFAFCLTVWAWLQTIFCLCQLQFIRATIWFSIGSGMLFWWMGTDVSWDEWVRGSAVIVGMGALATFARFCSKRKAMQAVPTMPVWIPPKPSANDNRLVTFSLHAKRES